MWNCSSRDQNYSKMIVQNKSTPDISGLNGIFCCPPLLSINVLLQAIYLDAPLLPCLLHVSAHLHFRRINTCGHLFQSYWEAPNLSNSRHQLDCWIFSKGEEWFLLVCKFSCKPPSLMVDHGNHSLN